MRFVRGLEGVLGPALAALVFAGYPTVLRAQTTSASVSGSIQDSQSAVLPGVTVTMTSRTQGNVLTGVTDSGGRFVFPIVRPDTYTLQVTLEGFKTLERTNLGSVTPGTLVNIEADILAKHVERLMEARA